MQLDKAIYERRSIRRFHPRKPDWRKILEAIDAARQAPAAGNLHCLKFILVDDPDKIERIGKACLQQFVSTANYIVVVCSDPTEVIRSYDERGEIYIKQQAGAAIENFLLKITDLGLGSCWIGAFVDEQVKTALRIPENINVEALLPVGYPMNKPVRVPKKANIDKFVYFNLWNNKYMKPIIAVEPV
ncbi:MAG: nitroreductase family protein [Candidatus Pacearchaeota archaeon]